MQKHDCDYGLLSSYHATIFAYRSMQYEEVKGKRRRVNVMVLSDMYEIGTTSSSHMFSWFLHALKASRARVPLPSVNLNLALDFMSSKKVKQAEKKKGVNFKFAVGPQIRYVINSAIVAQLRTNIRTLPCSFHALLYPQLHGRGVL